MHSGRQAMPLFYSNIGGTGTSETQRSFAVPQNWAQHGVKTLTLWFRGTAGNTGRLYVKINNTKVSYDGDAADMELGWQAWNITLSSLGVNLESVTSLSIGVEGVSAEGTLLIDDIRLYPLDRQLITPIEPDTTDLVGHWTFDGDTQDVSGLGNHGTVSGSPFYQDGKYSQAMTFNGVDDYVTIDGVADDITSNDITLSAWVKMSSDAAWYPIISINTANGDNVGWLAVDTGYADFGDLNGTVYVTDDTWHHLAYTKLGNLGSLYVDGVLEGTHAIEYSFTGTELWSIGQEWDGGLSASDFLVGTVDDVRIYNRALSRGEMSWLAGRTQPFDKPFE